MMLPPLVCTYLLISDDIKWEVAMSCLRDSLRNMTTATTTKKWQMMVMAFVGEAFVRCSGKRKTKKKRKLEDENLEK